VAALASAGVDALAPPYSSAALAPPPPKRPMLQLAYQPEPSQPTSHPNPPPPPPPAPAPSVEAQLAAILASADDADEAARARTAGQLFRFIVTTSEELAQAHSMLLKYKEEEAERERVHSVAPRMRVAIT
jgi:hypothetical protein